MKAEPNTKLLSTAEVAAALGVSRMTLSRAIRHGHLPALSIGKSYALTMADGEAWYEEHYRPTMVRPRPRRHVRNRK